MTFYLYSKLQPATLIGLIFMPGDEPELKRHDLTPVNEFLQCSVLPLQKHQTFKPHKHISIEKTTNIAQESWVVLKGSVSVIWYDIDDSILQELTIPEGGLAITFRGGHNYRCLSDSAIVYEFKTGPYWGQKLDKEFLGVKNG
jgi:hypothetical protein